MKPDLVRIFSYSPKVMEVVQAAIDEVNPKNPIAVGMTLLQKVIVDFLAMTTPQEYDEQSIEILLDHMPEMMAETRQKIAAAENARKN